MTKLCHCTFLSACLPLTLELNYSIFSKKENFDYLLIVKNMVIRIKNENYLKRYDNMTSDERALYEDRVRRWLFSYASVLARKSDEEGASLQNVLQCSVVWNDNECRVFEEGICLLTALVGVDTWLPDMVYIKSAKRVMKRMAQTLEAVVSGGSAGSQADAPEHGLKKRAQESPSSVPEASVTRSASDTGNVKAAPENPAPARPKHIDQYVHLLPKKTQDRAAQYGPLMRELDEAREKLRLLMNDDNASSSDREAWAKKVTSIDKTIASIRKELDSGWDSLVKQGRVVLDDLGNARVVESEKGKVTSEKFATAQEPSPITHHPSDISHQPSDINPQTSLTSEQKARRRELRKWLTDTRRGNGDRREEHVKRWNENFKEYLTLEPKDRALKDQKILNAAVYYGISLPVITNE